MYVLKPKRKIVTFIIFSDPREGSIPRWAFDMELRRIQVETRLVEAVEGILGVLKDIRDDYRRQTYRR